MEHGGGSEMAMFDRGCYLVCLLSVLVVLSQQGQKYTTIVPQNFSLSFDLTPTGIVSSWSSIIHYSGDGSDSGPSGRIPGKISLIAQICLEPELEKGQGCQASWKEILSESEHRRI